MVSSLGTAGTASVTRHIYWKRVKLDDGITKGQAGKGYYSGAGPAVIDHARGAVHVHGLELLAPDRGKLRAHLAESHERRRTQVVEGAGFLGRDFHAVTVHVQLGLHDLTPLDHQTRRLAVQVRAANAEVLDDAAVLQRGRDVLGDDAVHGGPERAAQTIIEGRAFDPFAVQLARRFKAEQRNGSCEGSATRDLEPTSG